MYNLRRNNNFDRIFKFKYFLFISCFTFFLYQSINLLNEFMSGKTVTTITYGIIRNTTLPAITICPHYLDFRKLSMLNENVLILYQEYLRKIEKTNRSTINGMGSELVDIYGRALQIFLKSKTPNININDDIIENLKPFNNQINKPILSAYFHLSSVHGDIDNDLLPFSDTSHQMISLPMESII